MKIQFDKPEVLDGEKLTKELAAVGVIIDQRNSPILDGDGNFWLDIEEKDKEKATAVVASHNG